MNTKILAILLALAGEAIIALIFFSLIPYNLMPQDVRVLDFIVTSVVYLLIILNILTPLVNMKDSSHKEIGGLGVRWWTVSFYSISAILVMLGNIFYSLATMEPALAFGWQAVLQGILFIILLWGLLGSQASMDQTKAVYEQERKLKENKADVKAALTSALHTVEDLPGISASVRERISRLLGEIRYLSPSLSQDAVDADRKIIADCDNLIPSFSEFEMNEEAINQRLDQLERDIERRRKLY